jgi:hypothetical protein
MIEHMFESISLADTMMEAGPEQPGFDPAWAEREPRPGEAAYEAYLAYEAQQIAFWNAYAVGDGPPEDLLPNLNGARTDAGLLAEIGRAARAVNAAEGRKMRAIADYAHRAIAHPVVGYDERMMVHSVEAEIGLALRVPPSTASRWVHLALTLSRRLPETFASLQRGDLGRSAAEMIADESANLDVAQCARLEAAVLADAAERSPRSLRAKVRREVENLDADAVRKRAERAREERCVYVKDEHDGMATLCLYAPAGVAHALYDALNARVLSARVQTKAAHGDAPLVLPRRDDRAVGAQRHDTLVDLLAGALDLDPWAPPVPESSVLDAPQIAHLDRGAATYRPSEAMKRAVRNRDKHCRFPGCRRPARFCDVDHTIAFLKVGGKLRGPGTVYFNLGALCRFHHQVKQLPGWHLEQDRGRFIWTTPTGVRLIVRPSPDDKGAELPDFARYDPHEAMPF